jgi:membrane protein YqaA with SNARE-associated domain
MRSLFAPLLGYFLSPAGVIVMAALDSSLIFFFPLGIDFVVIILSARRPDLFWLYPLLATAGSLAGAAVTFWIGRKVGQHGLSRLINPSRLRRVQKRVSRSAAASIAALAIIPPPFPFTAFVLTSGALGLSAATFFLTLGVVRILRFAIESALAAHYGSQILSWMESTVFEVIVGGLIAMAITGTIVSVIALIRGTRQKRVAARSVHRA